MQRYFLSAAFAHFSTKTAIVLDCDPSNCNDDATESFTRNSSRLRVVDCFVAIHSHGKRSTALVSLSNDEFMEPMTAGQLFRVLDTYIVEIFDCFRCDSYARV